MIGEVLLGRPMIVLARGKDVPGSESENMAWKILFDLHPFGKNGFISFDESIGGFD